MADLGPLTITARNQQQAEYLVRSRAEQRGVRIEGIDVVPATPGAWSVTLRIADADVAKAVAAELAEDTQVLHFHTHPHRTRPGA